MKKEYKTLTEELNRIKELSGIKLIESHELSERRIAQIWDDTYRWLEVFSTDNNNFLLTNNIRSGVWLRRAVESGKVTPEQLDKIATNGEQVFSTLPIIMDLKNKI